MNKVFVIGRDELPLKLVLGRGEELHLTLLALPGTSSQVELGIDIVGENAILDLAGLYLCSSDEDLAFKIDLRHLCGGSVSRQLFKGIVGGGAKASFDGLVYVAQDAQKTKAYQENNSLLLSPEARSESRPQLEIYADDVECSHGATSGYLNADEQFYMRSRGITEDDARRLQMISFISPVVSRLPEELQQEVYESLSKS